MSDRAARSAGSVLVAVATALVLVALAIVPFFSPVWMSFAQARADAAGWTGFTEPDLAYATGQVVGHLLTGGNFVIPFGSGLLLDPDEIGHMVDVRRVFAVFAILATAAVIVLIVTRRLQREQWWNAVRRGAIGLAAAVIGLGVIGAVVFDAMFDLFHRIFFAGGNYTFDPRTDRLVQLFPQQFWFETSIAVGVVIVVLAAATAVVAGRRLRAASPHNAVAATPSLEAAR